MEYEEAVDIVSELFRIGQWSSNEYGERYAVLNGDVEIRVFQATSNTMVIQGMFGDPIETPSAANASEVKLRYLLQANFVRIIRHEEILAIDQRTNRLSTTRHITLLGATLESVTDAIESFINNIDFWDAALKKRQSFAAVSPLLSFFRKK